jgi:hypothetical protein
MYFWSGVLIRIPVMSNVLFISVAFILSLVEDEIWLSQETRSPWCDKEEEIK